MTRIRILGRPYTIIEKEPHFSSDIMMGRCNGLTAQILIRQDLDPFAKRQTILHEIVHAIGDDLSLELSEQQVAALGVGLASIEELKLELRDAPKHPDLAYYLRDGRQE